MRINRRAASWMVLVALFALAIVPATAAVAHDGSFQHYKSKHFHTKKAANNKFVTERWAIVDSGGNLLRGERVVSASRISDGAYSVKFNRDVSDCAFTVTPLATNGALPIRMASASIGGLFAVDTVGVGIFSSAGSFLDGQFSLIVTC